MRFLSKSGLIQALQKQYFNPGVLGLFINPFYFARRGLYLHIRKLASNLTGRLLDVGCGRKPYKALFDVSEYIGMEYEQTGHHPANTDIDVYYDGRTFPFSDNSFDSVLCNEVFEHVFNPDEFLAEIHRVLKHGGKLLMTLPFVFDEHTQPYDYARYTSFGLKFLLEKHGFKILVHRKSGQGIRVLFQIWNAYLSNKMAWARVRYIWILVDFLLYAIPNLLGSLFGFILPNNENIYLDNIILAQKEQQ